jgi:hypothetical protein
MKKETTTSDCCQEKVIIKKEHCHGHDNHPLYGLGVIGALFYFLQGAVGFSAVITGIFKAIFWPAILMFELLSYLQL